jgi:hypothetical protein
LEDFPSPACATSSDARQANIKQTTIFFITISDRLMVTIFSFY